MRFEFQMDVSHMCQQSTFTIAKEVAFFTIKLYGFGVYFIDMDVQLVLAHSFEITMLASKLASLFMNPLKMILQDFSTIAKVTALLAMKLDSF